MVYKRRFVEDDSIARLSLQTEQTEENPDLRIKHNLEFIKRLRQILDVEKGCKILEMRRSGIQITCICGKCPIPIFFTYEEISELLNDIEDKIKKREL